VYICRDDRWNMFFKFTELSCGSLVGGRLMFLFRSHNSADKNEVHLGEWQVECSSEVSQK